MTTNWLTCYKYRIEEDTLLYIDINERCNHARATIVTSDTSGNYATHCCMLRYVSSKSEFVPVVDVYNEAETQLFYKYLENWIMRSLPYQIKFRYYNTATNEFFSSSFISAEAKPPRWITKRAADGYKTIGIKFLVDNLKRRRVKI